MSVGPALVLAAQATERIRVGSFVYDNDFRHPALLAQEAATIDLLTDGRFDFGIGAGWLRSEYEAAGLAFDRGAVRLERLTESIQIIKGLLTGSPLTFEGKHYRIKDLTAAFKPVQQPFPPLVIGGGGPRLLGLAAREADIVSIMPRSKPDGSGLEDSDASAESFDAKIQLIREIAGDRFARLELNTLLQEVVLTDSRHQAAERIAANWAMTPDRLLESPLLLIGSADQMAEQLSARRARYGLSYISIFERHMSDFGAVMKRLL